MPRVGTLTLDEFLSWVQDHIDQGKEPLAATAEVAALLKVVGREHELIPLAGGYERIAHDIWRHGRFQATELDDEGDSNVTPFERPEAGEPLPSVIDGEALKRPTTTTPLDRRYWTGTRWVLLGDMTKEDCKGSAGFYAGQARGNARKQKWMATLAEQLAVGQTVREKFDAAAVAALLKAAA